MSAILAFALFAVAAGAAILTIMTTVAPYRGRIVSLLLHGTQSRITALPPLPARTDGRAIPRLTASPAHLRAAA